MATKEELQPFRTLVENTAAALPPDTELDFRYMFGGLGAYTRGRMFAVITSTELALKLAPDDQAALLAVEGAHHWQISGEGPSKQYVVVPEALHTPDDLRPWLERSVTHTQTLPPPKPRRRRAQ